MKSVLMCYIYNLRRVDARKTEWYSYGDMDKALRPALMKVGEDDILPVRGPKYFINDNYEYTFSVDGDLSYFEGIEEIRKDGELIYKLHCIGGKII